MRKTTFSAIFVSALVFGFLVWSFWPEPQPATVPVSLPYPTSSTVNVSNKLPATSPIQSSEKQDLINARALLDIGDLEGYQDIRQQWDGSEKEPEEWIFMDAEQKLLGGQRQAAINILTSRTLTGKNETERLVRLAALNIVENPQKAWGYLVEASAKDPHNADLQLFKASLLESTDNNEMAVKEYITAVQKDPHNPFLREQLADFYIRTAQYSQALQILQEALASPSLDSIWLKAYFWNTVVKPIDMKWDTKNIPQGDLTPLISYLTSLPPGVFWDDIAFNKVPHKEKYLATRQETFWLRLIAALKNNNSTLVLDILNNTPFKNSLWAPQLANTIKTILHYRQNTSLITNPPLIVTSQESSKVEFFLDLMSKLAYASPTQLATLIPQQLNSLIVSPEAFAAVFLAQGWNEAGLQLHTLPALPSSYPSWVGYRLAKALHENRTDNTALTFATTQPATPELALYTAKLALTMGRTQEAFNSLTTIYKDENETGSQAALMIAPIFLEQGKVKEAKEAIMMHTDLANNIKAREILARSYIQDKEPETANRLYLSIEKYSSEAKSYLVRRAFTEKNWSRARQLTEELLKTHPDNNILKDNLKKIIAEQNKN